MAILSSQVAPIGQSGQVPKFIYLETNDDLATVTDTGYLNHFIAQGNPVTTLDMAQVSIQTSPNVYTVALFTVTHSGGDWSLVKYGAGSTPLTAFVQGGNTFGAPAFLGTDDNFDLTIQTNGADRVFIDSSGNIAVGSGGTFAVDTTVDIVLSSPLVQLDTTGGALQLTGVLSGPPVGLFNVLVNGSGQVSFSNVANAGSGTAWEVGGQTGLTDPSVFGTLDAVGIDFQVSATTFLSVTSGLAVSLAASGTTSLQIGYTGMPVTFFASTYNMSTNGTITITATAGNMDIGAPNGAFNASGLTASLNDIATANVTTIGNVSAGNNVSINSVLVAIPNMPVAAGGEQIVMWDPVTGELRHT